MLRVNWRIISCFVFVLLSLTLASAVLAQDVPEGPEVIEQGKEKKFPSIIRRKKGKLPSSIRRKKEKLPQMVGKEKALEPHVSEDPSRNSEQFERPLFAYLGMEGPALRRLDAEQQGLLERSFREKLAIKRFIHANIPLGSNRVEEFVRKFVKVIVARSGGTAKMKAEWDSQFQGFKITSKLLSSVQQNSFLYWFDVLDAIQGQKQKKIKYYKDGREYSKYQKLGFVKLKVRVYIRQIKIFDCRVAHRQKSGRHRRACEGKRNSDFAGFDFLYRTILVDSFYSHSWKVPKKMKLSDYKKRQFRRALGGASHSLSEKIKKIFRLYITVMKATFNRVSFGLGKKEGLRLNQGFYVHVRHVRGHLIPRGYVKVRSIGDNRLRIVGNRKVRISPNQPFYSEAQVLSTSGVFSLQKGMILVEDDRGRAVWGFHFGYVPFLSSSFQQTTPSMGFSLGLQKDEFHAPSFGFDLLVDVSDSLQMNEFFLDFSMNIVLLSQDNFRLRNSGVGPVDVDVGFFMYAGILKKLYMRRLALLLGLRVGFGLLGRSLHDDEPGSEEVDALFMPGVEAFTGLELFVVPAFAIHLRVGFRAHYSFENSYSAFGPWATVGTLFHF